ncbi:hypothetical protein B0H17DRAFT_1127696 [Mycena rosella]|uniref:Uncharacterized protein n=1 Tax=Mycena rosella TaxID=1033263 RepID=A0AAD7DZR4_MYCRO|nr:hypothetical protein B0H17DRAFT_1127696 [Mycena rosella]
MPYWSEVWINDQNNIHVVQDKPGRPDPHLHCEYSPELDEQYPRVEPFWESFPDDRKPIEKGKSTELRQWQVSLQCLVLLPLGQVSMFLVSQTERKENMIGMVALDVGMEVNALPELIQLRITGNFLDVQVVVGIYFGVLIMSRFLLLISYPHLRPYSCYDGLGFPLRHPPGLS